MLIISKKVILLGLKFSRNSLLPFICKTKKKVSFTLFSKHCYASNFSSLSDIGGMSRYVQRSENNSALHQVFFDEKLLEEDYDGGIIFNSDLDVKHKLLKLTLDFNEFLEKFSRDDVVGDKILFEKINTRKIFISQIAAGIKYTGSETLTLDTCRLREIQFNFHRQKRLLNNLKKVFVITEPRS